MSKSNWHCKGKKLGKVPYIDQTLDEIKKIIQKKHVISFNPKRCLPTYCKSREGDRPTFIIYADASGSQFGYASMNAKGKWLYYAEQIPRHLLERHINFKEMYCYDSIVTWVERCSNIFIFSDSQVGGAVYEKSRSQAIELNKLTKQILKRIHEKDLKVIVSYVKTEENPADAPSRNSKLEKLGIKLETTLHKLLKDPVTDPKLKMSREVYLNAKIGKFVPSETTDPHRMATNALKTSDERRPNYVFNDRSNILKMFDFGREKDRDLLQRTI